MSYARWQCAWIIAANDVIQSLDKIRTTEGGVHRTFPVYPYRKIFSFKQLTDIIAVPEKFTILRPDAVPEVRNVASVQQIKRTYFFCRPGLRVFPRSGPFRRGTLTTSRGSCPGADAKVFDASGKKFCGWYISPLDG